MRMVRREDVRYHVNETEATHDQKYNWSDTKMRIAVNLIDVNTLEPVAYDDTIKQYLRIEASQ